MAEAATLRQGRDGAPSRLGDVADEVRERLRGTEGAVRKYIQVCQGLGFRGNVLLGQRADAR